ncbi:MAG: recombinase family protein [Anaerolineales bacterium]|nr:recombinase family protein [Anaerolineales bacterium]
MPKRIGKRKIVSGERTVNCGKRVCSRKRNERGVKMEQKAALYARVSTTRQEREATIESQVAELENYGQEQGYEIDDELIFLDQAVPGLRILHHPRGGQQQGRVALCFVTQCG